MGSYISSNANRFYIAPETSYGQVAAITALHRIPALKLGIRQQSEVAQRKDKTGTRTYAGAPSGGRRRTSFDLRTYLTDWDKTAGDPAVAPLYRAALGGTPLHFAGGTAGGGSHDTTLTFSGSHGLAAGQAVAYAGEMRFVDAIVDTSAVQLNAPFTRLPPAGAAIPATLTLVPATELPSVSIFDYWSPVTSVQRILCGAAMNKMEFQINGDYHEVHFSGIAQELIDSTSFSGGIGELEDFPPEPDIAAFDYSIVPGHMGQAWLGTSAARFYTITSASVKLDNALDVRSREFGSNLARAISPGKRAVSATLDLFSQDDDSTKSLYEAAKQQSPISVMFQLGEVDGQLTGVYLKSVIPEVPEFNDGENRLQWQFRDSRAQGTADDEITVAFA